VALSFAGAQRDYVERVAAALQARGMRCFYDADEQIDLWGKYLAEELPAIYGEQAAAVVVFVSAEYAARDWTRLERRAALNRAVRERRGSCCRPGSMTRHCPGCCRTWSRSTCGAGPRSSSPPCSPTNWPPWASLRRRRATHKNPPGKWRRVRVGRPIR